jgi:hypothetical protein
VTGADRIPRLPLGELHPADRCWRCGAPTTRVPLQHPTTLPTLAVGLVCDNVSECERRYYRLKHGITATTAGRWAA